MFVEDDTPIQDDDLYTLVPLDPEWQPILHASNQVVLYNPTSHALSVRTHSSSTSATNGIIKRGDIRGTRRCPYCHRSIGHDGPDGEDETDPNDILEEDFDDHPRSRVPNYFQLLEISNETASVPSTPQTSTPRRSGTPVPQDDIVEDTPFRPGNMAEGYFEAFFQEECRLGMGANGSVYLCRHVLNGNPLGHFAVKKIAVGQSPAYLLNILQEVRLLEKLHHPNIITYHHTWLETCQFSSFGPKVPTLHVLMQWAEGGSLDDFIDARLGKSTTTPFHHLHPNSSQRHSRQESHESLSTEVPQSSAPFSRGARIRAFRAMQHAAPEERERLRRELGEGASPNHSGKGDLKAVHLLSAEEVKSLFQDVVEGLAFLHEKSILHLDLKPGNVLLTWDEGKLIPRAMLSDFGTSQDMLNSRARSGNTGTLEYASPESLPSPTGKLSQIDSKSDMWSLGMILHKLLFFQLPYRHASDSPQTEDSRRDGKEIADLLEKEVLEYPGFKPTQALATKFDSRHLPRAILVLLESLLNVKPSARPSCDRVLVAIKEGKLDPALKASNGRGTIDALTTSLVPVSRRYSPEPQVNISSSSRNAHDSPSELPPWDAKEDVALEDDAGERTPTLGLPSPPAPKEWAALRFWNRRYVLNARSSRLIARRTAKSCLLVAKVWTLFKMFLDSTISTRLLTLALGLAIADTWFDGFIESFVLGLAHIGLIYLAPWWTH